MGQQMTNEQRRLRGLAVNEDGVIDYSKLIGEAAMSLVTADRWQIVSLRTGEVLASGEVIRLEEDVR